MKNFLLLVCLASSFFSMAQKAPYFQDSKNHIIESLEADRYLHPTHFRTLNFNLEMLKTELSILDSQSKMSFQIPLPNGQVRSFELSKTMVMPKQLAAKYPGIKTYTGFDGLAIIKLDITDEGFHAMIIDRDGNTVFVDPYAQNNTKYYISYFKKDYRRLNNTPFECGVDDVGQKNTPSIFFERGLAGDCQLRTYTLALACTGEYASYHGGTVTGVLSSMNTSLNRINGVYERDLGLTLILSVDNDQIIFLNSNTDPYTNNSGSIMLNENQTTCDNIIGFNNYDIGHVFSTGGGGIAQLYSPCGSGKARGVTGSGNPVGDSFDIDYVAHEMGHQFGGNHSQNNSCNNAGAAGIEPGSASTIMGYAGICSPNVQTNSDDYYNAYSINEIANYMVFGNGNSCADVSSNGNTAPNITVENTTYNIPHSTPFKLTASGVDSDGDNLTYCWEQMDGSQAAMPPEGTSTNGPLFRSLNPTSSPTRYFLNLVDLFNDTDPTWEELPAVNRTMDFRCTLRDNHMGLGCTDEADVTVNVASSGPFMVTTANTPTAWVGATTETVTWDLGGSNTSPVNCSLVDILLWEEGGMNAPILIQSNVANTGSATILVPNISGNNFRLLIQASNNIFFDISNANITIQEQLQPTYNIGGIQSNYYGCIGDTITVQYTVNSVAGFNELVDAYISLNENDVEIVGLPTQVLPGTYSFSVIPNANTPTSMFLVFHSSYNGNPTSNGFNVDFIEEAQTPLQVSPIDGATGIASSVELNWQVFNTGNGGSILIDTNPDFTSASSYSSGSNSRLISNLDGGTIYYWKIRTQNGCGFSDYSPVFAFQTAGVGCNEYNGNPALPFSDGQSANISFEVGDDFIIASSRLELIIDHSYVGDVSANLSQGANTYSVFDRPGSPASNFGCSGDDLNVIFDDLLGDSYDVFEGTCNNSPAISGIFQSLDNNLSNLVGQEAAGSYSIELLDNFNQDNGVFQFYNLILCYDDSIVNQLSLINNVPLNYAMGVNTVLPSVNLLSVETSLPTDMITYLILTPPTNGMIFNNGVQLGVGDTYTQADVNSGAIVYLSSGTETYDSMLIDIYSSTNSWIHNVLFEFNADISVLYLTVFEQNDVNCFEGEDGSVLLLAFNGSPDYSYSLDSITYQDAPLFDGLAAGQYTFYVKDGNDDVAITNVTIGQPTIINIDAVIVDGQIVVSASGGVGVYNVDPIGAFENGDSITIYVEDANGCTQTLDYLIHLIDPVHTITNPTCYDESYIGSSITLTPTQGVEPYTYSLDGGSFVSTNTFFEIPQGMHAMIVMDGDGNQSSFNFDVFNPTLLTTTSSLDVHQVTINATGGLEPYMYSSNGIDFVEDNVLDLLDGVYTLTTMDALGCTTTEELIVSDIEDLNNFKSNISLYPNPSSGYFEINFGQINEDVNINVYNVVGKLIYKEEINTKMENKKTINIDVADGVYEVVVSTKSIVYPQKIVILKD